MGAFVLPVIAATVVITIVCSWIALAHYDRKHPPEGGEPHSDR